MSDEKDKPKNLKVIEFKAPQEDKEVPKYVHELLEVLNQKIKEGKLKTLLCQFHFQDSEDEPYNGGTVLWNESNNPMELLGLVEVFKTVALDLVFTPDMGEEE